MNVCPSNLGDVKGWWRVLRFTIPSLLMMLFISSYTIVDGTFVSNFINSDALASLNILTPLVTLLTATGFMFATGGSAYVSNLIGRGEPDRANRAFTLLFLTLTAISVVISLVGMVFIEPLSRMLGADDTLLPYCVEYGRAYMLFAPFLTLQFMCTQFLIVAGRPGLSLGSSIVAGITNIVMDYVLIVSIGMGVTGAAVASGMGSLIPSLIGIALFLRKDMSVHFTRTSFDRPVISSSCSNGISEMVTEISNGVTALFFNIMMMRYLGPDGVSAITVMMYVEFLAIAAILGYSNGVAPVMSYNHGSRNRHGMGSLFRISMTFVLGMSIAVFLFMELFSEYAVSFFVSGSPEVMDIATEGAVLFSIAFLFMGVNIYASSMFTSLSNGRVSALISACRTLIILIPLIVALPLLTGDIDTIWLAVPITEMVTCMISIYLMKRLADHYGYLDRPRDPDMA